MKNLLTLVFMIMFLTNHNYSQSNISEKMIWLEETYFKSYASGASSLNYRFKVGENGEINSAGFFGNGIRPYISSNPNALAELNKFKFKRTLSFIGYSSVFAGVLFVVAVGPNKKTNETYTDIDGREKIKRKTNPIALVGLGVSVTGLIIGGFNYFSAAQHMKNAVNIYNEDLHKVGSNFKGELSPIIGKDSFFLNYSMRW